MNRFKIRLCAIATFLLLFNVQISEAMSFFNLAEAASCYPSSSNKSRTNNAYNSIDVSLTDAARYGNSVRIGFVMKNTSRDKLKIVIDGANIVCGNKTYELFAASWGEWGLMYSSLDYGYEYMPGNAQIKGYLYVKDVPKGVTAIDKVNLYATFCSSSDNGYSFDISNGTECKTLPGIAIEPYRAANAEGCYSTDADITPSVISFQRSGTTVTLTFSMTNANKVTRLHFYDWTAYDENGTTYKQPMVGTTTMCEGKEVWNSNIMRFSHNAAAIFSLKIKDVPTSVSSFSMIRIPIVNADIDLSTDEHSLFENMLVFRNLNITEAPKTSTIKKTTSTNRTTSTRTARTRRTTRR